MLNIRHYRIFKEVVETGSMSKAAKNLFLTQPTVSQAILDLENHYQTKLFDRFPQKLYLKPEGEILYKQVKNLLFKFNEIESMPLSNNDQVAVKIGASDCAANSILNSIIQTSKNNNSKLDFFVNVNNSKNLEQSLLNNELDFIITEGSIENKDIIKIPITEDCLVLACGKNHPLALLDEISLEDFNNQPFIVREKGSGTRKILETQLKTLNINYIPQWECNSFESVKQAIINNYGIGLISARLIITEFENGDIIVLKNDNLMWKRDFYFCYHKNKNINENFKAIIDAIATYNFEEAKCPIFDEESCHISKKIID